MQGRTIGKLAAAGGVGVETIRYYQRRGLLEVPDKGGTDTLGTRGRRYGEADLRRLRFIRAAQQAGFTLNQIAELIALDATQDRARARAIAEDRIRALDAEIAALQASRDALASLAHMCASGSSGPCPILSTFEPDLQAPRR